MVNKHSFVAKEIEQSQVKMEGYNFDLRKHLLEYDDVINKQREVIYGQRYKILTTPNLKPLILDMLHAELHSLVETYLAGNYREEWDFAGLATAVKMFIPLPNDAVKQWETLTSEYAGGNRAGERIHSSKPDELEEYLNAAADEAYEQKEKAAGSDETRLLERLVMLSAVDRLWVRHLTTLDELRTVTPEQALRHPTWQMGRKITVDCATLFNKGLEAIEARFLFDVPLERVAIVMHRESIVHSLVEFADGAVKAQLGLPDMRLPIQYALLWDRASSPAPRFDWAADRTLHFGKIDVRRYPCFAVVLETARSGDLGAMVGLSAADELAVERFLRGGSGFTDIADLLRRRAELGAKAKRSREPDLDEIVAIDASVRASLATPAAVA